MWKKELIAQLNFFFNLCCNLFLTSQKLDILKVIPTVIKPGDIVAMMQIFWFSILCFVFLIGLTLVAEAWFYDEEQEL
jgi:hypothetical protein